MTRREPPADGATTDRVTVAGEDELVMPLTGDGRPVASETDDDTDRFSRATIDDRLRCSTGDEIDGPWTGIPVRELLAAAGAPDDATHVVVTGRDGFQVCVDVAAAVDGVLAVQRGAGGADAPSAAAGGRATDGDVSGARSEDPTDDGLPRFVSPAVTGTRTVRDVVRIEAVRLDAGDDPAASEDLRLGERDEA